MTEDEKPNSAQEERTAGTESERSTSSAPRLHDLLGKRAHAATLMLAALWFVGALRFLPVARVLPAVMAGAAVLLVLLFLFSRSRPQTGVWSVHAAMVLSSVAILVATPLLGYWRSPTVWYLALTPVFAGYAMGVREAVTWGGITAALTGVIEVSRRLSPITAEYNLPEDELWVRLLVMTLVVGVITVVTVRAHKEQLAELAHREKTIRSLVDGLSRKSEEAVSARDAAIAASRAKGEFLAMMSHEIRTPLNAVLGLTGVLLDAPIAPDQREIVRTIRASGDSLLLLLNDILDFSKIEAGRLQLENAPFDVVDCAEDALDLFSAVAAEKGLDLSCHVTSDVPVQAFGDAGRVRQVLVNLVSNAVKFTLRGHVEVLVDAEPLSAREDGADTRIHFEVRDSGIGIPADRLAGLFQPFSQVDVSTTRRFGGTGLGLAICRTLAESMGGKVWAESEKGLGSTFHFTIVARSIASIPSTDHVLDGDRAAIVLTPREGTRVTISSQLKSFGVSVTSCAHPSELNEILVTVKPDLIVVDEQVPNPLVRLAVSQLHHAPSFILLSAAGRDSAARRALREHWGPDPVIVSIPVRRSAFREAVDHALGVDNTPPPRSSGVPALSLDLPLRILVAEDNPVNQRVALLLLERLGYRADVVANGAEATLAVHQRPYDVVLMDVRMPEMDGIEATRRIRAELPKDQQPRIIALTANAMAEDRKSCEEAGMNDFLSKPITAKELERALRSAKPSRSPSYLSDGALGTKELDTLRRLTAGAPELLHQIIDDYLASAERAVAAIKDHAERGALREVEQAAHSLKGSSAQMGAHPLMLEAAAIERAATAGEVDVVRSRLEMLERKYVAMRAKFLLIRDAQN
ncbi:MAG: response regulator [Polyangiaceae bacterium]|nr:response regulator [Polyangiaceae bacterium]